MDEITSSIRKKRSKPITLLTWSGVALLTPASLAWVLGRWSYWFDMVAAQQMLIGWIALAIAILILISRRQAQGTICLLLAVVSLYPTLTARNWLLPHVDPNHKPDGVIRIVSCNINPENLSWQEDLDLLLSLNADVVILIELPIELNRSVRKRGLLDMTEYQNWAHRAWVDMETSPGFILSKWPMHRVETGFDPDNSQHHLYMQIQNPLGNLVVGLAHPLSPRTTSRWANGNQVVESHANAAFLIEKNLQLPVVVGADLNAGPGQVRARTLRRTGLRMSKPVIRYGASFPSGSSFPRAVRLQLDDIWTIGEITPISWDMIQLQDSDHMAVVVDCVLNSR